jgi:hypothetical protein
VDLADENNKLNFSVIALAPSFDWVTFFL